MSGNDVYPCPLRTYIYVRSCVCEQVTGRKKERTKVTLGTLPFPLSYFSLKERVGGGKERSGRQISFDISPCSGNTLFPLSVRLSVCLPLWFTAE